MKKLKLFPFAFISILAAYSQQNILIIKKKNRSIAHYYKGSIFSFQQADGQWLKGEFTKIQNDSFYLRPLVIQYNLMSIDTFHFSAMGFSLADVYAVPKEGVLVRYINGSYQIAMSAGHQHFYWIKSGWLFRVAAAGYAGLNIVNGIIQNDLSFSKNAAPLGIAATIFLGGILLHKTYKLTHRMGKKYQLKIIQL